MKKYIFIALLCLCFVCGCSQGTDSKIEEKSLTNYNIDVKMNCEEKTMQASESVDYINNSQVVFRQIKFHLYANAFKNQNSEQSVVSEYNFDKAYPNGFDSGYIDILSVKNQKNVDMQYSFEGEDNNILCVKLEQDLYPTERVVINIDFFVKIPNILHRFGYGENTINVGNFYPIACVYENGEFNTSGYHYNGDPFYSEMANYSAQICYDNSYTIGTSGKAQTVVSGDEKITKIKSNCMRDFAFILSQKYVEKHIMSENNKTDCVYLFYDDEDYEQTLNLITQTLSTFTKIIGDYPYDSLVVAQSNFLHGGMEYPLLTFISDAPMKQLEYYEVIVHEIAHQWFYNIIGNNEVSEAWLDEGLTEYATLLFFEQNPQYGINYQEKVGSMLSSYQLFVDVYTDVFGELDTSMNRPISAFKSEPEYTYCVYIKGVLMLDNLRSHIGDSAFFLGLKNYYEQNAFKIARQDDFISAFQKASNKDISKIIKSWLDGSVILQKVS